MSNVVFAALRGGGGGGGGGGCVFCLFFMVFLKTWNGRDRSDGEVRMLRRAEWTMTSSKTHPSSSSRSALWSCHVLGTWESDTSGWKHKQLQDCFIHQENAIVLRHVLRKSNFRRVSQTCHFALTKGGRLLNTCGTPLGSWADFRQFEAGTSAYLAFHP